MPNVNSQRFVYNVASLQGGRRALGKCHQIAYCFQVTCGRLLRVTSFRSGVLACAEPRDKLVLALVVKINDYFCRPAHGRLVRHN